MPELLDATPMQLLMQDMGLTERVLERRRVIAGLDAGDMTRIATVKDIVVGHVDEHVSVFFEYLAKLEEARPLLSNRVVVERARRLQSEQLVSMVQGSYGMPYATKRVELGLFYSRAGIDVAVFLGAYHHLLERLGTVTLERLDATPLDAFRSFMSLRKVAIMDLGIVVDVLMFERQRLIRQQQDAIRELSTPVLQIRERMLLLPIIGMIDTERARVITENLLSAIRGHRAKVVVIDVTGVGTIDSRVANHLLQTVAAARLMGASVIVTGLSADVAQSLVALGIDLGNLDTMGDLQGGLEEAERSLGYRVTRKVPEGPRLDAW